jgi:ComEC/Rec2-related protein
MIHRKISFFMVHSICLLLTLYTVQSDIMFHLCIIIAIITGGAGVSLFGLSRLTLKRTGFFLIAIMIGIFSGFSLSARIELEKRSGYTGIELSQVEEFSGVMAKDSVARQDDGYIHYIDLNSVSSFDVDADAQGTVMLISSTGEKHYTGEIISVKATLSSFHGDGKPVIHFISSIKKDNIKGKGFSSFLWRMRYSIHRIFEGHIQSMGYPASSLFEALFLGVRENLPEEMYDGFEKTGTLHILALSGLHVGIIYLLITLILLPLPWKKIKIITGFILVFFYLFIVGPRPSLLRASIMLIVFGTGYLFMREREPLNLLSIAACIILFFDPSAAFSLSFQLSFLAMLGIFIIGQPCALFLRPWLPRFVCFTLGFSIGAQIGTAPVIIMSFGFIYPVGILITLLVIPLVTLFLWTGIIFMILCNIPLLYITLVGRHLLMFLYRFIFLINNFFMGVPGLYIEWENWYLIFFILLFLMFLLFPPFIVSRIKKKITPFRGNKIE